MDELTYSLNSVKQIVSQLIDAQINFNVQLSSDFDIEDHNIDLLRGKEKESNRLYIQVGADYVILSEATEEGFSNLVSYHPSDIRRHKDRLVSAINHYWKENFE